ncbi:hypothetical protein Tco_0998812 [Tanacetum coccineum]
MVLGIPVISACVHAKTSVFDFRRYLSGPLRSLIGILCGESDLTITKLRVSVLERGAYPIVISNETSPTDQERSPENHTRGVFRSTLVALMVGFSFSKHLS